jgi:hypothetical protein
MGDDNEGGSRFSTQRNVQPRASASSLAKASSSTMTLAP